MVSVGGVRRDLCRDRTFATDLQDAAQKTPLERLLVETDAPYLTPHVVRKERNRPAYVAHTARFAQAMFFASSTRSCFVQVTRSGEENASRNSWSLYGAE